MARTAKTVVEEVTGNTTAEMTEKMNEEIKKSTTKTVMEELRDSDEIEVISLVPNVSYKDSKTLDMYEWD